MLYDWLDGVTPEQYGLDPALANLSARQAKEQGLLTSGTCGRRFSTLSRSRVLRQSLENRLQTLLPGSTLFQETWKTKLTPSGVPLLAHTASAHRTSGNGFTGWPSPRANNGTGTGTRGEGGENLQTAATLSTWPTPRATDGSNGGPSQTGGALSAIASWATPACSDGNGGKRPHADTSMTGKHPSGRKVNMVLASQVHIGVAPSSSLVSIGKRGQLNPAHSRWLMGYPAVWDSCGATAMQSCRKSQRRS